MAKFSDMGHGMRRRMGAPSNHHESAGHEMAERNHMTSDEAMEQHANEGSARAYMGAVVRPALQGTLMPRKNTQSADPSNPGSKQNRVNIERIGATYRVTARHSFQLDPAAGATMASARIVPSIQGRENPNFESGMQSSY
jgi:hypothetical protein